MSKTNCQTIQRELDEVTLGEDCSAEALEHLNECRQCHDFHEKQTKLRQIVGSLGTVSAPPDFDFRLRARLARENSVSGFHLNRTAWSFRQRGIVATMALVLLFGAVMMVRYFSNQGAEPQTAQTTVQPPDVTPINQSGNQVPSELTKPEAIKSGEPPSITASDRSNRSGSKTTKKGISSVDYASTRASVVGLDSFPETSEIFPIDAAEQSLKVSLFDSRGNPQTISVPTVSFGSKRVIPVARQFAPKGSW